MCSCHLLCAAGACPERVAGCDPILFVSSDFVSDPTLLPPPHALPVCRPCCTAPCRVGHDASRHRSRLRPPLHLWSPRPRTVVAHLRHSPQTPLCSSRGATARLSRRRCTLRKPVLPRSSSVTPWRACISRRRTFLLRTQASMLACVTTIALWAPPPFQYVGAGTE